MAVAAEASGPPFETAAAELATERGRNPAFDGIRFIAVAAVLASHFGIPGGQGGFLGVDIFFVLSGFLITGILLGQVERGDVLLGRFWARRVRRLAPALLLLILAIIVWGAEFAPSTARDDLRGDITATLLYVANWHFIAGTSTYFASTLQQPSPLLHMWSLAVEEQFYVLWPVVLFLVAFFVRGRSRLPLVFALSVAGAAVSAVRLYSLWQTHAPDRAYMGTDSRMFELLIGAVLAVLLMWRPRLGSSWDTNWVLLIFGTGIIAVGLATLGRAHGGPSAWYPDGGAVIFSLGAAALIWAVATRRSPAASVLAFAPIAYLGRISYGIYVWHWPLVCWMNTHQLGLGRLLGVPLGVRVYILTALTVGLAALSYHLVEKPIRYGTIGKRLRGIRIALALPAALAVMLALNVTQVVVHAGAAIRVPGFAPNAAPRQVTKTIVVVGDSVSKYFAPELAEAATKYGYTVVSAAHPGCPATGRVYGGGASSGGSRCLTVADEQDAAIRRFHPALVLWWSRYEVTSRVSGNGQLVQPASPADERAQHEAFAARAAALSRLGARVVAIQIEHPGVRARTRLTGHLGATLLENWPLVQRWNQFLAGHHGPRIFSIGINDVVCNMVFPDAACADRLPDGKRARPDDGIHYSIAAGPALAPVIITRALRAAGLPPYAASR